MLSLVCQKIRASEGLPRQGVFAESLVHTLPSTPTPVPLSTVCPWDTSASATRVAQPHRSSQESLMFSHLEPGIHLLLEVMKLVNSRETFEEKAGHHFPGSLKEEILVCFCGQQTPASAIFSEHLKL